MQGIGLDPPYHLDLAILYKFWKVFREYLELISFNF